MDQLLKAIWKHKEKQSLSLLVMCSNAEPTFITHRSYMYMKDNHAFLGL